MTAHQIYVLQAQCSLYKGYFNASKADLLSKDTERDQTKSRERKYHHHHLIVCMVTLGPCSDVAIVT